MKGGTTMATRPGTRHAWQCALQAANDHSAGLEASSRDPHPGGGPDSRRVLALLSHRHGPGFPSKAANDLALNYAAVGTWSGGRRLGYGWTVRRSRLRQDGFKNST